MRLNKDRELKDSRKEMTERSRSFPEKSIGGVRGADEMLCENYDQEEPVNNGKVEPDSRLGKRLEYRRF
jgi:hypothetical protein